MDNDRLIHAVNEYFTDFGFKVSDDSKRRNFIANDIPSNPRNPSWDDQVSAKFISARMVGPALQEDLEILMIADDTFRFSIRYPRPFLTPARNPNEDDKFDLEHLIAENIVFQVDETIRSHSAVELDGSTISDYWI